MKSIGILGGLGPKTTAKLYLEILNSSKLKDYPEVVISNVSFPKKLDKQILSNNKNTNLLIEPLSFSINQLQKLGIKNIILPCNTLEELVPEINQKMKIKLITPVQETIKNLTELKIKKVGMIATSKTKEIGLYENKIADLEIVYPSKENQKEVSEIIFRIISNDVKKGDKVFLEQLIEGFKQIGCKKVIFGCTDISNIINENDFIIDSFLQEEKKNQL